MNIGRVRKVKFFQFIHNGQQDNAFVRYIMYAFAFLLCYLYKITATGPEIVTCITYYFHII